MGEMLSDLIAVLRLEQIDAHRFRGQSQDLGWGRVFGGQVLGQALSAAEQTVSDGRMVHSMHGYFLRPGDVNAPIVYTVDPIREGRSFATRRVVATQHDRAIFNLSASFQIEEEGFEHQPSMPPAPSPTTLLSEQQLGQRLLSRLPEAMRQHIPQKLRSKAVAERPIELRPVDPLNPIQPAVRPPRHQVWFRTSEPLSTQHPHALHQQLLAYTADFSFLTTSLRPHGVSWLTPGIQTASLDHSMWFHRPFRMDEWLLYDIESPSASGARGLVMGRVFNQQGVLVASTAQEGLIRDRRA